MRVIFSLDGIAFFRLGFDARDTRWVGAWWIGFVITAIAFTVVSIPIFGYPKYMPGSSHLPFFT